MLNYYFNSSSIFKYLRKVLNEINNNYIDSGLRGAFILKRYLNYYKVDDKTGARLALLCLLKDIGSFYMDKEKSSNIMERAASSYTFLKNCSPFNEEAKPLLFYKSMYIEGASDDENYYNGLLLSMVNSLVMYDYQEYGVDEMIEFLTEGSGNKYHPKQVKNMVKLLKNDKQIFDLLNNKTSLYVYETSSYIAKAGYTDEELLGFVDTCNYAFEFHNSETLAHTITTAIIARSLAKLSNLTEGQVYEIYLAALLHDIGKIKVAKEILCYPGRLDGSYLKEMKNHAIYTDEILEGCFSYKIVEIARNHHERLDGSGYPRGLFARDLSIGDKIIQVSDMASALYCKRSYKESFSKEQICSILTQNSIDNKLDTRLVNHFINNFDEIIELARKEELLVLNKYENVNLEYKELINSDSLKKIFENSLYDIDIIED